jgi:hypothetical protein
MSDEMMLAESPDGRRRQFLSEVVGNLSTKTDAVDQIVDLSDDVEIRDSLDLVGVSPSDIATYVLENIAVSSERGFLDEASWAITTFGECEKAIPYARLWQRRNAADELELTCGHSPEHVTVLG